MFSVVCAGVCICSGHSQQTKRRDETREQRQSLTAAAESSYRSQAARMFGARVIGMCLAAYLPTSDLTSVFIIMPQLLL